MIWEKNNISSDILMNFLGTWTLLKSQQLGTYIFCHKIWKILDIHVDLKQNINIWNSYIK